jgi:hypothetical protein
MMLLTMADRSVRIATRSRRFAEPRRRAPRLLHTAAFIVALCTAVTQALADTPRDILQDVARCTDIASANERLRCFDAAGARARAVLAAPSGNSESNTVRRAHESFGLTQPPAPVTRPEQFGRPMPRAEELQKITANTSEFRRTPRGKALFVLDNGQIWRQLDSDGTSVVDPPSMGFGVTIERGALGSYNLTMEGRSGLIKVMRVK